VFACEIAAWRKTNLSVMVVMMMVVMMVVRLG
jgi:hypothetical protein